jgi:D-inositol-3-phosphate glycosyltransferase
MSHRATLTPATFTHGRSPGGPAEEESMRTRPTTTAALRPRRFAVLSLHTSPLDQPGSGDAGGLNVYVSAVAHELAKRGVASEIFTRAVSSDLPPVVETEPGVVVRHLTAGPYETLPKEELPSTLCSFTAGVLRAEAAENPGYYDAVHSHYWLSGQVGFVAAERWAVPHLHSAHTLAKVKNTAVAEGDTAEPRAREVGEQQVLDSADRILANTRQEAAQLHDLYGTDREQVAVVPPGVDLEVFRPGEASGMRTRLGVPPDGVLLLFVGRLQPLKGPDVLLRAVADLLARRPELRRTLSVAVCGGPSHSSPRWLPELATGLGLTDVVRFLPPVGREGLVDLYRAADLVAVPSSNESFGLVAVEAQACGTPVIATAVGGLRTSVADGTSGLLVPGHAVPTWSDTLERVVTDAGLRRGLARGAVAHAAQFGWDATAEGVLTAARAAMADRAVAVA